MRIKGILPYFGAKRTLAKKIVSVLGAHTAYFEPFCGSMAVLLEKEPVTMETVNDLHGDLINLGRVVQCEELAVELYAKLSKTLIHEALFREQTAAWRAIKHQPSGDKPDVDRAWRFFVCSWQGMNGVAGTQSYHQGFCARYTKKGGHAALRFRSAIESIPDWFDRLRSVTILSRDGIELIDKIEDAEGVCVYCDPPYLEKGATYVHDFKAEDHERLAETLRRFESARVVVSYYDHPLLDDLYPGWVKIDCSVSKCMVASGKRGGSVATVAPEVLLVNERLPLFEGM